MTDREGMALALKEAEKALEEGELPIGCAIVRGDEVLSVAHNAREATKDPTAHAEVLALRKAGEMTRDWRLKGATVYVTLEPCPMCAGAIRMARADRVVYGAADAEMGCAGSVYRLTEDPALGGMCPADGGVEEEKCAALLARFFALSRKKTV